MEEEHLLSFIDVCDCNDMILDTGASMMYQADIQEAYCFSTIDGDVCNAFFFGNVADEDDIPE